jgi:hypothetical protein
MKKIIMLLIFTFLCQLNFGQVDYKKPIFEENAKKSLETLKTFVTIQPNQEQAIFDFFIRKQKQYTVYNMTKEYREKILIDFEAELKSLIDPKELSRLEKNRKVVMELISDN